MTPVQILITLMIVLCLVLIFLSIRNELDWREEMDEKKKTAALDNACLGISIHEFSKRVALAEGLKKQVSIAQIKEILKVTNNEVGGKLYQIIKGGK